MRSATTPTRDRNYRTSPEVERLYRGFVQVAIKPQYSDAINRGIVQRVFEPARKKADPVIEQPVALEIGLTSVPGTASMRAKRCSLIPLSAL
jgi:hypothetical protein